ncbi:MAG: hypothetical protein HZA22_05255 [Nitrospirae bacterium]|nr:hypothetical protein [Nitrospirota bacterium]
MKIFKLLSLTLALTAILASGCASSRNNIVYTPPTGAGAPLPLAVKGTIISVTDAREQVKTYTKQVIKETDYSGNARYDINDRTVEDVFTYALQAELGRLGVNLVSVQGVPGPLTKETAEDIRKKLQAYYPNVKVAFGAKVNEFMAESRRGLVTKEVNVKASMHFFVLDVETGDTVWSDFQSDFNDTVAPSTADHNYMVGKLGELLTDLMARGVKDNSQLKEFLMKTATRQ